MSCRRHPSHTVVGLALVALSSVIAGPAAPSERASTARIAFVTTGVPYFHDADLFVVGQDGRRRNLTQSSRVEEISPAWSPDGARLAFARRTGGGDFDLYVRDAEGVIRRLSSTSDYDFQPAWSADGGRIAFVREAYGADVGRSGIWVMQVDGSGDRQLTSQAESFGIDVSLSWSPDGASIAFLDERRHVQTVGVGDGVVRPVWADHAAAEVAWQPDGQLAIVTGDVLGPPRIHVFSVSADDTSVREVPSPCRGFELPIWSTDGRLVACHGGVVTIVTPDGRELQRLQLLPRNQRPELSGLSLSAEPRRLVYSVHVDQKDGDLATVNADGTDRRVVLADPAEDDLPALSPDGRRIAFVRCPYEDFACNGPLLVVDSDGQHVRPLRPGLRGDSPAWSPDGSEIAFGRSGRLFVVVVDGRAPPRALGAGSEPAWSPDGRRIASVDRHGLSTMTLDGRRRRLVFAGLALDPDWSPDGSRIAFADDEGALRVVRLSNGAVTTLADDPDNPASSPSWSTDGEEIVFTSGWTNDIPFPWQVPKAHFLALSVVDASGGEPRPLAQGDNWDHDPDWGS